jgi:hypothetical protein
MRESPDALTFPKIALWGSSISSNGFIQMTLAFYQKDSTVEQIKLHCLASQYRGIALMK